jgi:hypothetical protein
LTELKTIKPGFYSEHFTIEELACHETGIIRLADDFIDILEDLREMFNRPMVVTSGCRSMLYNAKIGGVANSFHIYDKTNRRNWAYIDGCCAVDVAVNGGAYRGELASIAWRHGWSLGFGKTFLHLDARKQLIGAKQTSWTYG